MSQQKEEHAVTPMPNFLWKVGVVLVILGGVGFLIKLLIPSPVPPVFPSIAPEEPVTRNSEKLTIADQTRKSAKEYYDRGVAKWKQKDYKGALADYDQAIRIDPNDEVAYNNRGLVKNDLGDRQGTLADYNRAIQINPNYAIAYYNRGNTKDDLGDKQGALADYDQAIRINPKLGEAYNNRGVVKYALGNKQGACQDVRISAQLGHITAARNFDKFCD